MNDHVHKESKGRNWCLILGCGCLVVILIGVALVGFGVWGFGQWLGDMTVVSGAVDRAAAHPEVAEALGLPIEAGFGFSGSISIQDDRGKAEFTVPLDGSRNDGTLAVQARREKGVWIYESLEVTVAGQDLTIDVPTDPIVDDSADEAIEI